MQVIDWLVWFVITGTAALAIAAVAGIPIGAARQRRRREEWAQKCARARERDRLSSEAKRQNTWFLAGNPRGVYGDYPPAT